MKHVLFRISFLLLLTFSCTGCGENESIDFQKPEVKIFVQQIKTNRYMSKGSSGSVEIPNFRKSDIYALLIYAKDNTPVRSYPVNPEASGGLKHYRLSQCLLWTIEKIRIGKYPSYTPQLLKTDPETGAKSAVTDTDELTEAWNLYYDWWMRVENQHEETSAGVYNLDPLQGTPYSWK